MPRGGDASDPPQKSSAINTAEVTLKKPPQVRPPIDGKGQSASKC